MTPECDTTPGTAASSAQRAYAQLVERFQQRALLGSTASLLAWDQEVMMPAASVAHRSRQAAQLAAMMHERLVDRGVSDRLAQCREDSALTSDPTCPEAVNLREWQRSYDRAVKVPADLVEALARCGALAKGQWSEARRKNDFSLFAPHLAELVQLSRDKAACLQGSEGGEPWDALADSYEPGMTAARLEEIFTPLGRRLQELAGRYDGRGTGAMTFHAVDAAALAPFVRHVATQIGFDFSRGRLDTSAHPFCSTINGDDVRMTTRFECGHPLEPLFSTIHEAGHGIYNQGLPSEHWGTPRGSSVSYAIHESQSRMWENMVARSSSFWAWLVPEAKKAGLTVLGDGPLPTLVAAANGVRRSLIRVEADETTYNLHIIVRFELERALIRGELEVRDLPGAWREQYERQLGVTPPDAAQGCLQDIHWSKAAFGYFPSYALGNLYAAQFFAAAQAELPDLDRDLATGRFASLGAWLNGSIHEQGMTWDAETLCRRVTGQPLTAEPFLAYLEGKLQHHFGDA